jgi:predicted Zn-dependent protease
MYSLPTEREDVNTALKLHFEGNINFAKKAYEAILKKDPDNSFVLTLMGTLYVQEDNPKEAINYFIKSLKKIQINL